MTPAEQLYEQFYTLVRINIKNIIENPSEKTWTTYQRARRYWNECLNIGYDNEKWTRKGYPIREPLPQDWGL